MESVLIIFASRRGSTETAAHLIAQQLGQRGQSCRVVPAKAANLTLILEHSIVLLGSSTWGNGDLHEDFWSLERELQETSLQGRRGAAFGCGSSRYPAFGWAAEILENLLRNQGAKILQKHLRCDTLTGLNENEVIAWAEGLADRL